MYRNGFAAILRRNKISISQMEYNTCKLEVTIARNAAEMDM